MVYSEPNLLDLPTANMPQGKVKKPGLCKMSPKPSILMGPSHFFTKLGSCLFDYVLVTFFEMCDNDKNSHLNESAKLLEIHIEKRVVENYFVVLQAHEGQLSPQKAI